MNKNATTIGDNETINKNATIISNNETISKNANTTTIGEDLHNATIKTVDLMSKKAGELTEKARNSEIGQKSADIEEKVADTVHNAAKATVNAVDDAVDATKKAFKDFSQSEPGQTITKNAQAAGDALSQKGKEIATAAQNKIDELRREEAIDTKEINEEM